MSAIISTSKLCVSYGQTKAIENISFDVHKGDFVGLVGPNGGGKTTLAKALLGLLPIRSGKIRLFGQEIANFNDYQKIGYLPQKQSGINSLFPASGQEVVSLGLLSCKKWPRKIDSGDLQKIDNLFRRLDISNLKNRMFFDLSGGQQQKVLLARALINGPEVLFLDEPSAALDPQSRQNFFELLEKINKQNHTTIILITHDTGHVGRYANKLLYVDRKLIFFGDIGKFCKSDKAGQYFERTGDHIIWHQHD